MFHAEFQSKMLVIVQNDDDIQNQQQTSCVVDANSL